MNTDDFVVAWTVSKQISNLSFYLLQQGPHRGPPTTAPHSSPMGSHMTPPTRRPPGPPTIPSMPPMQQPGFPPPVSTGAPPMGGMTQPSMGRPNATQMQPMPSTYPGSQVVCQVLLLVGQPVLD